MHVAKWFLLKHQSQSHEMQVNSHYKYYPLWKEYYTKHKHFLLILANTMKPISCRHTFHCLKFIRPLHQLLCIDCPALLTEIVPIHYIYISWKVFCPSVCLYNRSIDISAMCASIEMEMNVMTFIITEYVCTQWLFINTSVQKAQV